eukprot:6595355-Ditylum_brightwellii.AAC.1
MRHDGKVTNPILVVDIDVVSVKEEKNLGLTSTLQKIVPSSDISIGIALEEDTLEGTTRVGKGKRPPRECPFLQIPTSLEEESTKSKV